MHRQRKAIDSLATLISQRLDSINSRINESVAAAAADEIAAKTRCEGVLVSFVDDLCKFEKGDSNTPSIAGLNHYLDSIAKQSLFTVYEIDSTAEELDQVQAENMNLQSVLEPLAKQIKSARDGLAAVQLQRLTDERRLTSLQRELVNLKSSLLSWQEDRLALDKVSIQRPKVLAQLRQTLAALKQTHADLSHRLEASMRLELIGSKELDNISRIYLCFCFARPRMSHHHDLSPRSPTAADRSLASIATLQAQKIDIIQKQVSILSQCLLGVCASWYNSPDFFTEETARILLDYLQPCRSISQDTEELFRAVYYTAGSPPGPRKRQAPVPPPPFDAAPPPFSTEAAAGSGQAGSSSVLRQGDYWRATVTTVDVANSTTVERVRNLLSDKIFGISLRRIDVFPSGPKKLAICLYDSDDPSAKAAATCIKDICELANQASMTVAPTGTLQQLSLAVQLPTWKFLGLADDLAQLYKETRGYTAASRAPLTGPPKDWRTALEEQLK